MVTDQEIIAEVRSWIGGAWIHGQALKGPKPDGGADCIQFIIKVAKTFGWVPVSYKPAPYNRDYALHNDVSLIKQEISKFCDEVVNLKVGDVMLYISGRCASHAGIYIGNNKIVHAHIRRGIVEDGLKDMKEPLDSIWRFKQNA